MTDLESLQTDVSLEISKTKSPDISSTSVRKQLLKQQDQTLDNPVIITMEDNYLLCASDAGKPLTVGRKTKLVFLCANNEYFCLLTL